MSTVLLYALLCPAFYYLGSRARITNWLWTRYPRWLASFMDCAACTSFWYGAFLAATIGRYEQRSFLDLPPDAIYTPILVGLCMLVLSPIVGALFEYGLAWLGTALGTAAEDGNDDRRLGRPTAPEEPLIDDERGL